MTFQSVVGLVEQNLEAKFLLNFIFFYLKVKLFLNTLDPEVLNQSINKSKKSLSNNTAILSFIFQTFQSFFSRTTQQKLKLRYFIVPLLYSRLSKAVPGT